MTENPTYYTKSKESKIVDTKILSEDAYMNLDEDGSFFSLMWLFFDVVGKTSFWLCFRG